MRFLASCLALAIAFTALPPPAAAEGLDYNLVRLDAEATAEVPNDLMRVTLVVEHQSRDAAALPAMVNGDMGWALGIARQREGIRAQTGDYGTQPEYASTRIVGWRATQELLLESEDFAAASEVVGELQQKLQVRGMSFLPRRATREKVEAELTREALKAFAARAQLIAESMGAKGYEVVELNVGGTPEMPLARMRAGPEMMVMSAEAAPIAIEGGTATLKVNVDGRIQLR